MASLNWQELFAFSVSPLELIVRGSAMYWFLFLIFRFPLRRDAGSIAIADILLFVIVADAAQNAMAGDYKTVTDGFVLVGTIALWNFGLDWLGYRIPTVERLLQPPPLLLVRNGKILHRNLRKEMMSVAELHAKMREAGYDDEKRIRKAFIESDGQVSVIPYRRG